jgi:hypothetical protein
MVLFFIVAALVVALALVVVVVIGIVAEEPRCGEWEYRRIMKA